MKRLHVLERDKVPTKNGCFLIVSRILTGKDAAVLVDIKTDQEMDEDEHSSMEIDESNEDDPVVKEIPVFVSKRMEEQIYIFQYPLRPKSSKSHLNVKKCFIKPRNQAAKLEVQLNTASSNFNIGKAEEIALRVDGPPEYRKKDKEIFFKNDLLDKVTYVSSKAVEDPQHYALGVYNGREYHITPLKGLIRLKPYYPHLDRDVKKKQEGKHKEPEEEQAGPSKAQQVTVKFSRSDNDRWKKAQENSYKKIMERSAEEPWIECDWHPEKSELSELEKAKLFAEDTRQFSMVNDGKDDDPIEYIRRLVPEDQEQAIIKPSLPSNVVSFSSLRQLPSLFDQCKLLLKDAKMIPFQQLLMLLAGCDGLTPESLLKTLPQVAVLVRGNWIVKSEILFPSDTFSAISGVPAEAMCRARDYILILFTKNQYVERRKVSSIIKVPSEEIKEIFMGISKLRYNKGWELALPVDIEFINKYPDVVQRQSLMWEQREIQLSDFFKESTMKDKKQRRKSKSVSEDSSKGIKRDNHGNHKESYGSSDTDSGTEKNKSSPIVGRRNKVAKTAIKCDNVLNHKDENS